MMLFLSHTIYFWNCSLPYRVFPLARLAERLSVRDLKDNLVFFLILERTQLDNSRVIYCLMYNQLFVGVLCLSLFCYALLCVHSRFEIIKKRKRKLVALLLLSYRSIVLLLFLTVPWVGLQCVIVVFLDHTHLLFVGSIHHWFMGNV